MKKVIIGELTNWQYDLLKRYNLVDLFLLALSEEIMVNGLAIQINMENNIHLVAKDEFNELDPSEFEQSEVMAAFIEGYILSLQNLRENSKQKAFECDRCRFVFSINWRHNHDGKEFCPDCVSVGELPLPHRDETSDLKLAQNGGRWYVHSAPLWMYKAGIEHICGATDLNEQLADLQERFDIKTYDIINGDKE